MDARVSSRISQLTAGLALVFLALALWSLLGNLVPQPAGVASGGWPSRVLLVLAGGQAILYACIELSRGIARAATAILVAGVDAIYTGRALVIVVTGIEPRYDYVAPLTPELAIAAIAFVTLCAAALWLGLRVGLGNAKPAREVKRGALFAARHTLLIACFATVVLFYALRVLGSIQGVVPSGTSNLLPDPNEGLGVLVVVFLLSYRKELTARERAGFIGVLVLAGVLGLATGSRGFAVQWIPLVLVAATVTGRDPRLRGRVVVAVVLAGVLLLPALLAAAEFQRDVVRLGSDRRGLVDTMAASFGSAGDAAAFLSDRLSSFDALVAAIGYKPGGIDPYVSIASLTRSLAISILPDSLFTGITPPLGLVWAHFYDSVPWDAPHHGAPGGFGTAFLLMGWTAPLALLALGLLAGSFIGVMLRVGVVGRVIAALVAQLVVFSGIVSGNVDTLGATLVREIAVTVALLAFTLAAHDLLTPTRGMSEAPS